MTRSRRDFFRALPVAIPSSWSVLASALHAAPAKGDPDDESYWLMVKRQFPLEEGLIYLNAANVCPASRPVMDRHQEYLRDFHANPSFQNRDKYAPIQERTRAKVAQMLSVAADEIAITRNTSEGSNLVVRGIDLKPGDEVVITDHNHPSNNDSWKVRAKREGIVVRSVPVTVPALSRSSLIDGIEKAITPKTRVIAVTHLTSTTGILYPAKELAEIARRRGIWMHLDGAQTWGALDVNLRDIGCDSYSSSAHKWPMGPLEAGILYVRAERIPQLWPSIVTAGWADNLKGARKFEVFGQRDNPRICGVEATVDFLNLIGMPRVEGRLRALTSEAKRGLAEIPGVRLLTNQESDLSGGVIKFRYLKRRQKEAYDQLWTRHRLATSVTDSGDSEGIRFSPHIYNSMDEIRRAVAAVRELAG
jgi:selenocysteine lyase/cysteine desulfurase